MIKIPAKHLKISRKFLSQLLKTALGLAASAALTALAFQLNEESLTQSIISFVVFILITAILAKIAQRQLNSKSIVIRILSGLLFIVGTLTITFLLVAVAGGAQTSGDSSNMVQSFADTALVVIMLYSMVVAVFIYLRMVTTCFRLLKNLWQTSPEFYSGLIIMALLIIVATITPEFDTRDHRLLNITDTLTSRVERVEYYLGGETLLQCDQTEMVNDVSKSIVRVIGKFSEGSGVIIDDHGTIVTNYHVVAGEPSPTIVSPFYEKKFAQYVMTDRALDLAVLTINTPTSNFLEIDNYREFRLKPLDTVYSFGFPFGTNMAGRVTVQEGRFVSYRDNDDLHTDLSLQKGQSGGALVDRCGYLHGINQSTLAGASFSIANSVVRKAMEDASQRPSPVTAEVMLEFKETESPLEAIRAFYNYQSIRQLEKAYTLLSPSYLDGLSFDDWSQGYRDTIGVELITIEEMDNSQTIFLKFASFDLVGDQRVTRFFEGTWTTERAGEGWLLVKSSIVEVKNPEMGWFW